MLYRQLPRVKRYLAYLPEGPVIDWDDDDLAAWLDADGRPPQGPGRLRRPDGAAGRHPPLERRPGQGGHRRRRGAPARRRPARASAAPPAPGSSRQLRELGWRPQAVEGGFAAGQPQYNFQIPLRDADGNARTEDDVLKGMNQQWRRNIKKAAKEGVEVTAPAAPTTSRLFHDLYVHTAERDHFTPRPLSYFRTMFDALGAEEPDRIRSTSPTTRATWSPPRSRSGSARHAWYSYGASSTEKREVRGSNAVQWAMIRDALAAGADVYDLRGITDTLDADDPHVGLIQFKVGTGGEAVEYVGEWDLPLNRPLYKAFDLYMSRRR